MRAGDVRQAKRLALLCQKSFTVANGHGVDAEFDKFLLLRQRVPLGAAAAGEHADEDSPASF